MTPFDIITICCTCNHDYGIVPPSKRNAYVYTKASEEPIAETGWTVALPSMSKLRHIVNGQSVKMYNDAEMGIIEIYENGIVIKCIRFKEEGSTQYINEVVKTIEL